ncbi:MAG: hypothetical protein VKK03_07395 [Synechococcus sp.]|nr:hypothetical protein [Synechococcus sp.]
MPQPTLDQLEHKARTRGLLLRLQVSRPLGLWTLRLVVAEPSTAGKVQLLGEMKAWAHSGERGLQLDTMRVLPSAPAGVGALVWAATLAWALEATPCRHARLLAIEDAPRQHRRLVRYFKGLGFLPTRRLGAGPVDLPLRLIWGGAGQLMVGDCTTVLARAMQRLEHSWLVQPQI